MPIFTSSNYNLFYWGSTASPYAPPAAYNRYYIGTQTYGEAGASNTAIFSSAVVVDASTSWRKITSYDYNVYGIKSDGTLWGWGDNNQGQLLIQNPEKSFTTQSIGNYGCWYITSDNRLLSAGQNTYGSMGTNFSTSALYETLSYTMTLASSSYFTNVSAGNNGAVHAIDILGRLWGWGFNANGAVGDNSTINRSAPVQITTGSGSWTSVSAGHGNAMAMSTNGNLYRWGYNGFGQLGDNTVTPKSTPVALGLNIIDYSISDRTGAFIKSDNSLWMMGDNTYGQLGQNNNLLARSSPVQIGTGFLTVTAGALTIVAKGTGGQIYAWGLNSSGQLGLGDTINRSSPVQIGTSSWVSITCDAAGTSVFALNASGTLFTWGKNITGSLSLGDTLSRSSPTQVSGYTWSSISEKPAIGCFGGILSNGAVRVAGGSAYANMSVGLSYGYSFLTPVGIAGATLPSHRSSPVQLGTDNTWIDISAKYDVIMGIKRVGEQNQGTLWAWGTNEFGVFGPDYPVILGPNYSYGKLSSPVQISSDSQFKLVSVGYPAYVYAQKADNTLWSWGYNNFGQLGLGDNISRSSPTQLGLSVTNSPQIAQGYYSTFIRDGSKLYSVGYNFIGMLGLGDMVNRSSPVQIPGSWNFVAAGWATTTAGIKSDGSLWTWGSGLSGCLGDGTTVSKSSPVKVGTSSWTMVAVGASHMAATTTAGVIWGWGTDTELQYNAALYHNGTAVLSVTPLQLTTTVVSPSSIIATNYGTVLLK